MTVFKTTENFQDST